MMRYHSVLKKKKEEEEGILNTLSERCQYRKTTYSMIPAIWHAGKGKAMETLKMSIVSKGQRGGRDEQTEDRGFLD